MRAIFVVSGKHCSKRLIMLDEVVDEVVILFGDRHELEKRNAIDGHRDGLLVTQLAVMPEMGLGLTQRYRLHGAQ